MSLHCFERSHSAFGLVCEGILQELTSGINADVTGRVRSSNTKQQVLQSANKKYIPWGMTSNNSHSIRRKKMQDFQHEQLFTDLTSEEAAVVEGGALVLNTSVDFDTLLYSRSFKNNVGSKIEADLSTRGTGASNPSNTSYNVTLQRLTGGRYQDIRSATAPINGSKNIGLTH